MVCKKWAFTESVAQHPIWRDSKKHLNPVSIGFFLSTLLSVYGFLGYRSLNTIVTLGVRLLLFILLI